MNEPETWPPAPGPQNTEKTETAIEIVTCPECKRRLLTKTSMLCNWCGAKINDQEYQARAALNRLERDQQERTDLEVVIQEEAELGVLGRLRRLGKQNKANGRSDTPL